MNNSDVKPSALIETLDLESYEKTLLSGVITPSGYTFFDNSTLESARTCLRYYYFKHIRKFDPLGIRPPLIFGGAWHSSMDTLWPLCSNGEKKALVLEAAFEAFLSFWKNTRITELDELDLYPRTPTKAFELLGEYYNRYGEDLQRYKILAVERPFIIPLTNDDQKLLYIGKIDKETEEERTEDVMAWDHKTGAILGSLWQAGFSPNSQMDGYHHAERMNYGNKFHSICIDGVQVHKTKVDFSRLWLARQTAQIESWLWETLEKIAEIQYNETLLLSYRNSGKKLNFLPAFPKNCKMCSNQYGKPCIYRDLCVYQNNPEDYEIVEEYYEENLWKPFLITEKPTKEGMMFNVESSEGE